MVHRSHLASIRVRRFRAAADDFVERADFHPASWARSRAEALVRHTLQLLASRDAFALIHQFSKFFTMARLANIDPIALSLAQPLNNKEARQQLLPHIPPSWLVDDNAFIALGHSEYKIVTGVIPRLACFGYLLFEVEPDLMLDYLGRSCDDFEAFSASLNRSISSALSSKSEDDELSNHHYRAMFDMTRHFEDIVGENFSALHLRDEDILSCWQATAVGDGNVTRLTEFLRLVSAFTAAVRSEMASKAASKIVELDDPDLVASPSDQEIVHSFEGPGIEVSCTHPVILELLTDADLNLLQFLLSKTDQLVGLYLSRARALAFSPLENRLIEAKRRKLDLTKNLPGTLEENAYASLLEGMNKLIDRLEQVIRSAAKLAWEDGRAVQALDIALVSGMIESNIVEQDAEELALVDADDDNDLVTAIASKMASNERWLRQLSDAAPAWKRLKRRLYFADLPTQMGGIDTFVSGALHAANILNKLNKISTRMECAVNPHLQDDEFQSEWDIIKRALGAIHLRARKDH